MKPVSFLYLICLTFLAFLPAASWAQQYKDTTITLKWGDVPLPVNAGRWLDSFHIQPPAEAVQVLVRFREIPSTEERGRMAQAGLRIADFIGGTVFTAIVEPRLHNGQIDISSIATIISVPASWKTDPFIDTTGSQRVCVIAGWYENIPSAALEQHIRDCGGTVAGREMWSLNAAVIELPANRVITLAGWYGIRYVSPAAQDTMLNLESGNSSKVNTATILSTLGGPGLDGSGVTVGVGDNYSGLAHVDLNDRIINFNPWPYHNHGVHINGIVGGAGIMDPKGKGMAPGVTLIDHLYTQVWMQTVAMKEGYNMTITNNSYAARVGNCNYAGTYDVYSVMLDNLSRLEPNVLHVFAAGNDGQNTCRNYPPGFGTVIGAYQAAKNVLVVANNTKWYQNAASSSRGPMRDGRIKPEISAVGTEVYSTIRDDGYLSAGGTSMASPAVAGGLALLAQRYKQLHGGADPRGDLLKTLILNGATDMGNPGPDYSYGFGAMNLGRSLGMLNNNRYAANAITHDARQTIQISVPPNTAELKLMLYWHDTAGTPAATAALVNDLDLEVVSPSGGRHLPLVLNSGPQLVTLSAMPGFDHINNAEQVVIRNPEPGMYDVRVSGFRVPYGPQDYVIAWDVIPEGVSITFPAAGAAWPAQDSLRIYWDAAPHPNSFTLEFSADNGGTWTVIDNAIPADQRYYTWYTPGINTHTCRLRLTRNSTGQQDVSAPFAVHVLPVLQLESTQCPGYMAVRWDPVPNATAYEVLWKKGNDMQPVDTVTGTTYLFRGLSMDSTYYVAVRPLIQGIPGWRSLAVKRHPYDGDCMGDISDGDLMTERIISPVSGRAYTTTAPGSNEPLTLMVRNLDDVSVPGFEVMYQVNNNPWQSQIFQQVLPANTAVPVFVAGLPLGDTGVYRITAVIKNLTATDPVATNDTIYKVVRHYPNLPVNLDSGFKESFETEGRDIVAPGMMGVTHDERWDFTASTDTGRLRFFASPEITITGERSVSLDARTNMSGNRNYLEGTFNLADYAAAVHEVRVEFDYKLHGVPKFSGGNEVWARGSDNASWISIYYYDTTTDAGTVINSGSLSLSDVLLRHGQEFTTSCQVRFGQHDTGVIAAYNFGNGLTLDDIRLYTVRNDVQLTRIVAPQETGCNMGNEEQLQVLVHNRDHQTQYNINLYYRLDSGMVHSAVLPSIDPKDSLVFTFPQLMDLSGYGIHTLDVWLAAQGDTYPVNDSLSGEIFRHQPFISSFPYLERFEDHDGYWYTGGKNTSWEYGTPAAVYIRKAASGANAWKTSLEGNYNNSEHSFLYSPCFDVSGLSNPMLSFSIALDIEQCNDEPCDAAWIEYSVDGGSWQKLGETGTGTNWYNTGDDVWSIPEFNRWHVASVPLPRADNLRLRFVFKTDPGVTMEGIAVDDIHIFDRAHAVYTGQETGEIPVDAEPDRWNDVLKDDQWIIQLHTGTQEAGRTTVQVYHHEQLYDGSSAQYFFPKNFVVTNRRAYPDSADVRIFISEQDFVSLIADTSCITCSLPEDVYTLGITQYADPDPSRENGSLSDNRNGDWYYYPAHTIVWVPYDNGYYAALKLHRFSELWLNDGGPKGAFPLTFPAVDFRADKINDYQAELTWISYVDTSVVMYELERSYDSSFFSLIASPPVLRLPEGAYRYTDMPAVQDGAPVYYRLRYRLDNGKTYFTAVRRIDWTVPDHLAEIYPNPSRNGHFAIAWSSIPDGDMLVSVADIMGRNLYRERFAAGSWNNITMIRLHGLAKGIYMVRVVIGNNQFERKLVIY